MCWACDYDAAHKLLANSEQVLKEAEILRKQGSKIKAQAFGTKHRALKRRDGDNTICKEIDDEVS